MQQPWVIVDMTDANVTKPARKSQQQQQQRQPRGLGLFIALIVLLVIFCGLVALSFVLYADRDDHNRYQRGSLILTDSQRLVLTSSSTTAEAGDKDIVLIVVRNADGLTIENISVTILLNSISPQRSATSLAVICPPLYVDNTIPSLGPDESVTCRAVYTLTEGDVLNGNRLFTSSAAVGTSVDGSTMQVVAVPGWSELSVDDLQIGPGAVIEGPTGPTGPVSVVAAPCVNAPPHTSLTCTEANEFQLLFCDYTSNSSQFGNIYECVLDTWLYYGHVGTNSSAGSPGISVYAATCAGGPPPTSITEPTYTCDSAFALNMVLCSLPSQNSNAGLVYQCICHPTCGWVQVANLNGPGPMVTSELKYGFNSFSNANGVWNTLMELNNLPMVGYYSCLFEGSVLQLSTSSSPCPLYYGLSSAAGTNAWIENSDREVNVGPASGSYVPAISIFTTAAVEVSTAPEIIYAVVGIGSGTTGCANWQPNGNVYMRITCIKINDYGYGDP